MKIKKHLSFTPLINGFKKAFSDYEDTRKATSTKYPALDTALALFPSSKKKTIRCMLFEPGVECRPFKIRV
jgi:hypothetical protein